MKLTLYIFIVLTSLNSCQSQTKQAPAPQIVGGPCQGCEALLEYGDKKLSPIDTLPDYASTKPKLKLTGTVFEKDGKTPAKDVILYIYQTDRNGIYSTKGNEKGWAKRHGYNRGWIQTDATGTYTFYTFRPAAYPNRLDPEHIHITVKEPNTNAYYIDSIVFDDDSLLTKDQRNRLEYRGGSGIVKPILKNDLLTVKRDIVLGLNIPDYE
ncbi:protocatechuate 3,4-dioxygenase beta subunit [Gelidibacter sediminis]|uniref:Protocatechuate 3,4-dioxygenase beta subunit n=1 Tax=Gelidibacter sediminis TaxID=1608710 RepID=A0A4R7PHM5_9FLAO|nr:intradiol ring-cleavage dioxygenase [Gelidibacter sediminis]TDU33727.1 protocatechuate 3,4-dioxygenase beta subunit [Gelidibacter sediminis]